jgi:hypothetical protein
LCSLADIISKCPHYISTRRVSNPFDDGAQDHLWVVSHISVSNVESPARYPSVAGILVLRALLKNNGLDALFRKSQGRHQASYSGTDHHHICVYPIHLRSQLNDAPYGRRKDSFDRHFYLKRLSTGTCESARHSLAIAFILVAFQPTGEGKCV